MAACAIAAAAPAKPAPRRLLARVLRFCAKAWRTKGKKLASSTPSSAKRGANRQRKTVECTSGGGENASGGVGGCLLKSAHYLFTKFFIGIPGQSFAEPDLSVVLRSLPTEAKT